jgi:hypothetical protein
MNDPLHHLFAIPILVSATSLVAACDSSGDTSAVSPPGGTLYVEFQVDEPWEYRDDQPTGPVGAILDTGAPDFPDPRVLLQLSPSRIVAGDADVAEQLAKSAFGANHPCASRGDCNPDLGALTPVLRPLALPSGTTAWAIMHPSGMTKTHFTRDPSSPASWGSLVVFDKAGRVFEFLLSDRADLYVDELDLVASTLRVELR